MPGALNESYSDIFGVLISNFREPDIGKWNWKIGEDLDGTGTPVRDISYPGKNRDPEHTAHYQHLALTKDGDNGGAHKNSGIHS